MFIIDLRSRTPIYRQIVDHFSELINAGVIKPGEKLPSVRDLAEMLTINPNTIVKAFGELERSSYVYTKHGLGTFAMDQEGRLPDPKLQANAFEALRQALKLCKFAGFSLDEIQKEVENDYSFSSDKNV
ncbi:MAG: GntR family transcriptional regulator [Oscillospiraceae bacterium]|nr:GntR family transcriptional regulator [Oscillospiraceae bacterium]